MFVSFLRFVCWCQHMNDLFGKVTQRYIVISALDLLSSRANFNRVAVSCSGICQTCSGGLRTAGAGTQQICSAADLLEVNTETFKLKVKPISSAGVVDTYPVEIDLRSCPASHAPPDTSPQFGNHCANWFSC